MLRSRVIAAAAALACGMTVDEVLAYAADYNSPWTGDVDYDHEPMAVLPLGC